MNGSILRLVLALAFCLTSTAKSTGCVPLAPLREISEQDLTVIVRSWH